MPWAHRRRLPHGLKNKNADYVLLALKGNHPHLYEKVTLWMDTKFDAVRLETLKTLEKDHERFRDLLLFLKYSMGCIMCMRYGGKLTGNRWVLAVAV
ncbi:MAG: hypothetical protein SVR94_07985 [Pseudomonadota bacterium]|nr:hypothetical protein [Pseudomonadota bacterium]